MAKTILDVDQLVVEYPAKGFGKEPFRALHGVSVNIAEHETLGLVGESGSGKTTLGRALLGLAPITQGQVTFNGQDITHVSRKERAKLSRDIQVVFQDPYTSLNPSMDIGRILSEPLQIQGIEKEEANKRIATLLDQVGLPSDAIHRLPREFSGGQRQRVAIARALYGAPKYLVMDEPNANLDEVGEGQLAETIQTLKARGTTIIFTTHRPRLVSIVDYLLVLRGGQQVGFGPAKAMLESVRNLQIVPNPDGSNVAESGQANDQTSEVIKSAT